MNYSTFGLLDQNLSTYESARILRDDFKDKNILILQIRKESDLSQQDLCEVFRVYEENLLLSRELEILSSPFDWRQGQMIDGRIWFPYVLPQPCQTSLNLKQLLHENPTRSESFHFGVDQKSLVFVLRGSSEKTSEEMVQIQEKLERQISVRLKTENDLLKAYWLGEPVYERSMKAGNESIGVVNLVAILVIVIFLFLFFRSKIIFLFFFLAVAPALLMIHGLMGLLRHDLNLLSLGVFLMLLIAVIEDFSFIFSGIDFQGLKWRKNFRRCLWPSFLTSWTTVLGFGSLILSDVLMVKRFGFYMALGAILEWALLFMFIPSLLHLLKDHGWLYKTKVLPEAQAESGFLFSFSLRKLSIHIVKVSLFIVPLGFLALFNLNLNTTPAGLFSKQHPINVSRDQFLKNLNYDVDLSLLYSRDLSRVKLNQVLSQIRSHPIVSRIEVLDEYVEDFLQKLPERYRNGLDTDIKNSKGGERFLTAKSQERAVIHLNRSDLKTIQNFVGHVHKICESDCEVGGAMASFAELGIKILRTLQESLLVGSLLVFLTLFVVARSCGHGLKTGFLLSATALVSPMSILCLFAFFKVEMNLVNCLCFSGLLGIAGDNIFQYLLSGNRRRLKDEDIIAKWKPSLFVGLTMGFLCLSFIFSTFVAVRSLGLWLCGGFILGLFCDYFFTRGLLQVHQRSKP